MGLTAHLAMAFDPADKAKVIGLLTGDNEDSDGEVIRYQPDFDLIREDNYEVHRVLEVLAESTPELAALGTIVRGSEAVAEAGMGIQYFYSADAVRCMADAYGLVTSDRLTAAIERVRPEFDQTSFAAMPVIIAGKFAIIRDELNAVAKDNWAMVAGMF